MIKAPFKRKATVTPPSTTPKDTPNSGRAKSMSQSNRTSAVNCMDSVSLCDISDSFYSNIYAEIDINNMLPVENSIPNDNTTNTSASIASSSNLHLKMDSFDEAYQCEGELSTKITETVTHDEGKQLTEENLYDIEANSLKSNDMVVAQPDLERTPETDNPPKINAFFTSLSKSLKHKLKLAPTEHPIVQLAEEESSTIEPSHSTNEISTTSDNDLEEHVNETKTTLVVRLKTKFKTGFKFSFSKNTKICEKCSKEMVIKLNDLEHNSIAYCVCADESHKLEVDVST